MIKQELKDALDKKGIKYEADATNAELEALLPQEAPKDPVEPVEPVVNEVLPEAPTAPDPADAYGKLSDFLKAYLKQNPRKFKLRWDAGELKDL